MADIGIILGSGLNRFSEELTNKNLIYEDSSGTHHKKIFLGKLHSKEIIIFEGRNHFYEKAGFNRIFFNINKAKEFGLKFLIITNAAGGLNTNYKVSDLMLIVSHINLLNQRLLKKKQNINYDTFLLENIEILAIQNNIKLHKGIYCASRGPMYETKAEINFMKKSGADAVGMSTIPEILFSHRHGIQTIGISCITNLLLADNIQSTNHEDVLIAGRKASKAFSKLLNLIIQSYPFI